MNQRGFPQALCLHNNSVSLWSDKNLIKNTLGMKASTATRSDYILKWRLDSCSLIVWWCRYVGERWKQFKQFLIIQFRQKLRWKRSWKVLVSKNKRWKLIEQWMKGKVKCQKFRRQWFIEKTFHKVQNHFWSTRYYQKTKIVEILKKSVEGVKKKIVLMWKSFSSLLTQQPISLALYLNQLKFTNKSRKWKRFLSSQRVSVL